MVRRSGLRSLAVFAVLAGLGLTALTAVQNSAASGAVALQAFASGIAVLAALDIAAEDRRRARTQADADRAAFVRRRDYEECVRLVGLIEADLERFTAGGAEAGRRSPEATALVLALWGKRSWWGKVADYYVRCSPQTVCLMRHRAEAAATS